jgi:hypothetical protein
MSLPDVRAALDAELAATPEYDDFRFAGGGRALADHVAPNTHGCIRDVRLRAICTSAGPASQELGRALRPGGAARVRPDLARGSRD